MNISELKSLMLEDKNETQKAIRELFSKDKAPIDKDVHALSDKLKINTHTFEGMIYAMLHKALSLGKHKDVPDSKFDSEQLKKGIAVEKEHTDDEEIAKAIAKDHLTELPDYYNRLEKMEKK